MLLRKVFQGLDRVPTSRTVELFRKDKLLLVAFVLLGIAATFPLWMTPFVPLVDMGANIGAASMLDDVLLGRGTPSKFYAINWAPTPYWGSYLVMGVSEALFGTFAASKIIVVVNVLGLPLAFIRLSQALGRSPRIGLLAFLVVWDTSMLWGWVAFSLGMLLAIYVLARLLEIKDPSDVWSIMPWAGAVALTHVHGVALLATVGVVFCIFAPGSRKLIPWRLSVLTVPAFLGTPWLVENFVTNRQVDLAGFSASSDPIDVRVASLFRHIFGYFPQEWAQAPTAAAFLALVLTPVLLGSLPRKKVPNRHTVLAVSLVSVLLALYLFLPLSVGGRTGQVHVYPRLASYFLLSLSLLPVPVLRGRAVWTLAPAMLSLLALNVAVARQAEEYAESTRPYLKIIEAIPEGARILPLDIELNDPALPQWGALGQIHGWLAGVRSAYDPHLFDLDHMPVVYKKPRTPYPNWSTIVRGHVDYPRLQEHYDYVIVYPKRRDPLRRYRADLTEMMEAGNWRLYKITPRRPTHPKGTP